MTTTTITVLSESEADAFEADWMEAWNDHDLERILGHYADDVEYHSPFIAQLAEPGGSEPAEVIELPEGQLLPASAARPEANCVLVAKPIGAGAEQGADAAVRESFERLRFDYVNADGVTSERQIEVAHGGIGVHADD